MKKRSSISRKTQIKYTARYIKRELIVPSIRTIRNDIKVTYGDDAIDNIHYQEMACRLLSYDIHDWNIEHHMKGKYAITCRNVYGEIAHNSDVPSCLWKTRHVWMEVYVGKETLYVDPTTSALRHTHIIESVPDFNVSETFSPMWYISDEKNMSKHGIGGFLNRHIRLYGTGIIEILQYNVWGAINDFFGRITFRLE